MESRRTFLQRVALLEAFKGVKVFKFGLKFVSTADLYNSSTSFVLQAQNTSPIAYGPIHGRFLNKLEAEQVMCFAIKTGNFEWIKENCFDNMRSSKIYYISVIFKYIFVGIMPHFPTRCNSFNKKLCLFLENRDWHWVPFLLESYVTFKKRL